MNESFVRHVPLPPSTKYPQGYSLPLKDRVLVVIGANGSGKTRFGAWLDEKDITAHRRVSAHRSLTFPDRVQPTDLKEAEQQLRIGHVATTNDSGLWRSQRWHDNPAIALLNDFNHLVTLLVSESFSVSDKYRVATASRQSGAIRSSARNPFGHCEGDMFDSTTNETNPRTI